ncbi:hypothetical protein AAES_44541 [Amazona aestiva]|uniref:Uncharacterized protein n=1 Tax=Amazona aestiva TaxID=12930 RepID=A0A0Q3MQV5_AMAAE|nr:hypothetical protein AAES_44541 [Amazona aestiva]
MGLRFWGAFACRVYEIRAEDKRLPVRAGSGVEALRCDCPLAYRWARLEVNKQFQGLHHGHEKLEELQLPGRSEPMDCMDIDMFEGICSSHYKNIKMYVFVLYIEALVTFNRDISLQTSG